MKDLEKALYDRELIVLRVIGEWWELDLTGQQKPACVATLAQTLAGLDMTQEMLFLSPEEAGAMADLIAAGGRLPAAAFERQHGGVRNMGPARLEREEPWLDPVSAAEGLWYRGFLYRAFDESEGSEMVEYYYLPTELYRNVAGETAVAAETGPVGVAPVDPPEQADPADNASVDDLTAILAASQVRPLYEGGLALLQPFLMRADLSRASLLFTLAWEMKLLRATDEGARPSRAVLTWLKKSRQEQARDLADAWSQSSWNELFHTPGLAIEGGWQNDPLLARTALLDALPRSDDWFRVSDVVTRIHDSEPDFQRPDGNYETWYIRDVYSGGYLSGFDSWDLVEGRLLRFLLVGPMTWLGLAQTARTEAGQEALYRLTPPALAWLNGEEPERSEVSMPIVVQEGGRILVPFNANRYERFQVARVTEAEPIQPGKPAHYRLTPTSLARASEQAIDAGRLLQFLAKASQRPVPAGVRRAVERWQQNGTEATLESVVLLKVRDPVVLEKLRANPKTRVYFAESMGDYAAVIKSGDWDKLRQAAAGLGLLIERASSTAGSTDTTGPDR